MIAGACHRRRPRASGGGPYGLAPGHIRPQERTLADKLTLTASIARLVNFAGRHGHLGETLRPGAGGDDGRPPRHPHRGAPGPLRRAHRDRPAPPPPSSATSPARSASGWSAPPPPAAPPSRRSSAPSTAASALSDLVRTLSQAGDVARRAGRGGARGHRRRRPPPTPSTAPAPPGRRSSTPTSSSSTSSPPSARRSSAASRRASAPARSTPRSASS